MLGFVKDQQHLARAEIETQIAQNPVDGAHSDRPAALRYPLHQVQRADPLTNVDIVSSSALSVLGDLRAVQLRDQVLQYVGLLGSRGCGAQIFRRTSELIENAGQSGSSANGRNSAVTSRSDALNSMDRDRLGTNTIRHNAQWAAILLPHPCRLCNLFGAERLSGFIRPIPLISDCREPSSAQAVGLLSRTSGAAHAADRRCSHQPCALVEVLRLAISFGDRQT